MKNESDCVKDELDFECVSCESQGLSEFKNNASRDNTVVVSIHNLPDGITFQGVKYLFLQIGTPLTIHFNPAKKCAYVTLASLSHAEQTIRHLHKQPPYDLDVRISNSKQKNNSNKCTFQNLTSNNNEFELEENNSLTDFIGEGISLGDFTEKDGKIIEISRQMQGLFNAVDYDPSYRVHFKNCDFEIPNGFSVSKGRGYFCSSKRDCHIGGLESYHYASEECENLFPDAYHCKNCNAFTMRICNKCSEPYCSMSCLKENANHKSSKCFIGSVSFEGKSSNTFQKKPQIRLKSPCTVGIMSFSSVKTLFVRCIDDLWEEKFVKLLNDVSLAALKEKPVEEPVDVGEVYSAKYYEDGIYYRCKVLSVNNTKPKVYFLDFGNVQHTDVVDLKQLPEKLKWISDFAIKVNLNGIPDGTSAEAVSYLNNLTARSVPLTLKFKKSISEGVILIEKESGDNVNEKIKKLITPSWRKDSSVLSKLGEIYYIESLNVQSLDVGKTYDLKISYINEDEFKEDGYFWAVDSAEDYFLYLNEEVKVRILEYCENLKGDFYLPRDGELCLARDNDEWRRCACLSTVDTTCWLFFIDDGKTSFVETKNIRKMIRDFLECPQQAVRCAISNDSVLDTNSENRLKMFEYLKSRVGHRLSTVMVKKFQDGDYHLIVPEIDKLIVEENQCSR